MARKKAEPKAESPEESEERRTAELQKRAADAEAEARKSEHCPICGVQAEDIDLHNAWHEGQQVKYTELVVDVPQSQAEGETVLFAPPVEAPEPAPTAITWTAAAPDDSVPDGLTIIHTP